MKLKIAGFVSVVSRDAKSAGLKADNPWNFIFSLARSPGFGFVFSHRWQSAFFVAGGALKYIAILAWARRSGRGAEISLSARIDAGLFTPHPYGIVIGDCSIGRDVTIQQNVTVGVRRRGDGTSPVIQAGCEIGAGAAILGNVTVGEGAVVGANSVVLTDIPPGTVAVGAPARVVRGGGVQAAT